MSENICVEFKNKLQEKIDENAYNLWIRPLTLNYKNRILTITAPSEFTFQTVKKRFSELINTSLENIVGKDFKVKHSVDKNLQPEYKKTEKITKIVNNTKSESYLEIKTDKDFKLSSKFTFESFVIGNNNQLSFAAANAVVNSLGKSYNPLFIYGSTGLGKTHLMQGIGHAVIQNGKKIVYVTCEDFTNKMIEAIKNRKMDAFRKKFRKVDLLLIDDIQFLANKDHTQEEFFNTFNALYNEHKQIVITSDCPPQKLKNLSKRLLSRFEWGLATDIQKPTLETRISILKRKVELSKWIVPTEIINYLAEHFSENVRQMEGALTRVYSYSKFLNKSLNMNLVEEILKDLIKIEPIQRITIDEIVQKVAKYYGVYVRQLQGTKRLKSITLPRHVSMYMSRELTDHSLPEIGEAFGGKDHTTILHACRKIKKLIESDNKLKEDIKNIQKMLNDG